jgi:hypothetical protein
MRRISPAYGWIRIEWSREATESSNGLAKDWEATSGSGTWKMNRTTRENTSISIQMLRRTQIITVPSFGSSSTNKIVLEAKISTRPCAKKNKYSIVSSADFIPASPLISQHTTPRLLLQGCNGHRKSQSLSSTTQSIKSEYSITLKE